MKQARSPRFLTAGCVAFVIGMLSSPSHAADALDKDAIYTEMRGIAAQMRVLKPNVEGDSAARSSYETLDQHYRELMALMGGDDPGQIETGSAARRIAAESAPRGPVAQVVPTTPAGCGQVTTTFTQGTPTAIPTGPAVVTSTVVVSGTGPFLYDLDLTTFLAHTFPADLDITLTSPAGTVVTLTTDNAGTNDNVFNGTVWDDDANPTGQVPYVTNDGMVTEHVYAIGVLASPLVPEEAMGAFIGEDPNGTWTITISDDLAGDGGSLDSWTLGVTTFPSAPIVTAEPTFTQSTPVAIPTGPAVVTSTLVVSGAGTSILDVDLTTALAHTFPADLDITLTSPAGTVVTLTTDNAGTNDNVFNGTVWDDDANPAGQVPYVTNDGLVTEHLYAIGVLASPLVPEEAMGAFVGEDPNGTWTITISDDLAGDGGSLDSWMLDIDTFACESSDLSVTKTDGSATATPGGSTVYTITISNAGPSAAATASLVDTFPAACTSVTFTSSASGGASGNTAAGAGNINDAALNLPAGASVTYVATCNISASATGNLVNTATAGGASSDSNPANDSATDTDTLTGIADLSITKQLTTAGSISVSDNIDFELTVSNAGPSAATGVVVTDTLPASLTYVSNDCGASFASPTLTWNVGNLAVSGSANCTLTVQVNASGAIANVATVTGNEGDPTPANNAATATLAAADAVTVPALDARGLALLSVLLGAIAILVLRR
ncbi:MAG TPA: IPTL-CTERM sorting domain-containing protein [Thermoanaerobaculia bacterium]|jgi:uncharacterized repeat protein (TIGR01451 family)|nr:IPTL-CTERM sorting domain-containing protein [Thermoanaerobaculia bacterium]